MYLQTTAGNHIYNGESSCKRSCSYSLNHSCRICLIHSVEMVQRIEVCDDECICREQMERVVRRETGGEGRSGEASGMGTRLQFAVGEFSVCSCCGSGL